MKTIKKIWNGFLTCFAMYTSIPMPGCSWEDDHLRYMFCFFPVIGLVIGVVEYGWFLLAVYLGFGQMFRAAVAALLPILISGGIHMDGFLDTMDAISSWRSKEERLRILKDPHMGAFGLISAGVYFVLLFGVWSEISMQNLFFAVLAYVISRNLVVFFILGMPRANPTGTVAAFYKRAGKKTLLVVMICWICLVLAVTIVVNPFMVLIFVPELIWCFMFYRIAMGYFGGITGDLAGFFISVSELVIQIGLVVIWAIGGHM